MLVLIWNYKVRTVRKIEYVLLHARKLRSITQLMKLLHVGKGGRKQVAKNFREL